MRPSPRPRDGVAGAATAHRRRWLVPGVVALACLTPPNPASAAHDPQRLADLIEAGRYDRAYQIALEHLTAHEGEFRFDFHYGIAALQVGELKEGVFALERVVTVEPGFDRARLELARGYFLLENDRRARAHFEAVLAHEPPAPVRAQIEGYLLAIERRADHYRTTTSGFVEIGAGHDSNINAATADDSVDTVIGTVVLDPTSQELDDSFVRFEARGSVSHPLRPGVNLVGGAGLWDRRLAEESEFETGAIDGNLGLMLRDARSRFVVSGQAQRFYLDGEPYRDLLGISASYSRTLSDVLSLDLGAQVSELEYDDDPELDSTLWLLDAGFSRAFDTRRRPALSAGVFLGAEEADADSPAALANTERDILGLRLGLWMSLAPRWTLVGEFEYRHSEYAEENLLFGKTREDDYYLTTLSVDWRPDAHWRIGPQLAYTNNDVNIGVFDYERTEAWVRARYEFF
ncbi:MAG: surface lipoprotein assembly modifier [Halofilum sp. (in: g-proteobacteria)]|nr:surface lipoprotein assembly modifier [Halofilum sp. (in: g-proteobacteria)]